MWRVYVNGEWIASFDNLYEATQCASKYKGDEAYGEFPDVEVVGETE